MIHRNHKIRRLQRGNATAETIVALVAFVPFLIGIPLLGKQLDVKHKSYDATRYAVWERTIYRSDGTEKTAQDIELDARGRILGSPLAGISPSASLRNQGVTENSLWRDRAGQRLLIPPNGNSQQPQPFTLREGLEDSPVEVGGITVPRIAYDSSSLMDVAMQAVGVNQLGVEKRTFATAGFSLRMRPALGELADQKQGQRSQRAPIEHAARGAILSDTWSPNTEAMQNARIDNLVANERVWQLEMPGMVLGFLGGKGSALYGEGQYGFGRGYSLDGGPTFTVPSTSLPNNYVYRPQ